MPALPLTCEIQQAQPATLNNDGRTKHCSRQNSLISCLLPELSGLPVISLTPAQHGQSAMAKGTFLCYGASFSRHQQHHQQCFHGILQSLSMLMWAVLWQCLSAMLAVQPSHGVAYCLLHRSHHCNVVLQTCECDNEELPARDGVGGYPPEPCH